MLTSLCLLHQAMARSTNQHIFIHTHINKNASSSPDHHHWWVAAASSSIFAKWGIDYVTHRYGGESTPSWKMNKWKYRI